MNKICLYGLAAAALVALPVAGKLASAQPASPALSANAQQRLASFEAKLNLTPKQQSAAQQIVSQARAEGIAIRNNQSLTTAEKRADGRKLFRATRKQLAGLLTQDQRAQAKQLITQAIVNAADKAGVTQGQQNQIKDIIADGKQQAAEIRQATKLSTSQKRAELAHIFIATRRNALSVLTGPQRQQLMAMKTRWIASLGA